MYISSEKHVRAVYTPLNPTLYRKLGYAGVNLFFLFLLQNIDCGYSLEPPLRGVSTIFVLSKNKKNFKKNSNEILDFLPSKKNFCILHGHVFVMFSMKIYSVVMNIVNDVMYSHKC